MSQNQTPNYASEEVVGKTIQNGIERGTLSVSLGLVIGGLASLVLARNGSAARKAITGFGGGVGFGSAWTRISLDLEDVLKK
mmetsp:Transcript_51948/g.60715  ORF Transcript_51948/g.60715 Transcript_51948/m.60715 type:complete len:82 (-) Transcript_51948:463-708(-)|eukprot:CAMPEP_0171294430 /NCGR_PEP_ID=MMETSP0816-20121228/2910_1 /TAXON_ID=420281 /ORGANISM="Proboscia inermis, Strain CCAP1064/1" /LENGTH=81 /DNA_ID=CAMNT_0011766249 /DNA_START=126 /DNA_END=371 /DNA_ORIENTATION=+